MRVSFEIIDVEDYVTYTLITIRSTLILNTLRYTFTQSLRWRRKREVG